MCATPSPTFNSWYAKNQLNNHTKANNCKVMMHLHDPKIRNNQNKTPNFNPTTIKWIEKGHHEIDNMARHLDGINYFPLETLFYINHGNLSSPPYSKFCVRENNTKFRACCLHLN